MSKYWYKRRYKRQKPEDFVFLLLAILVLSIFYPPIHQAVMSIWYIYAFAIVIIVAMLGYKIYHYQKLSKAGIYEIDKMSGTDFELFLTSLFSKQGYKVQHVGKIGDYGVDLIVEVNGIRTAVQAKRYKSNVGPDAVREVNTVIKPRNCSQGMVVTNSFYTQEARFLAKSNNIALWDRNDLVDNILKTQKSQI